MNIMKTKINLFAIINSDKQGRLKIFRVSLIFLTAFLVFSPHIIAQEEKNNPIKEYHLPDPLIAADNSKITTKEEWINKRRPEILEMLTTLMYGRSPEPPENMKFVVFETSNNALNGKAIRKQVAIYLENGYHLLDLLIYLPKGTKKPCPVFLGLNFEGNHTVHSDSAIRLSDKWVWIGAGGSVENHATEKSRGALSSRWPIEMIIENGYGLATVYAGDLDPDYFDNFKNGIHALYPELQKGKDNFSTIGAWAWGLSRCMDYFETDPEIDENRIAVMGFSRMGKAAIWAGAKDQRFAIVISNESGGGGASLSKRKVGEDVARLNNGNPHWFCKNFRQFNSNEDALPFDQHMVISLIAPRPVYIASAEGDPGSDPKGEFLAAKAASSVYNLFGKKAFLETNFPKVDEPVMMDAMGYHIRSGRHDIKPYDWRQFMDFADQVFKSDVR